MEKIEINVFAHQSSFTSDTCTDELRACECFSNWFILMARIESVSFHQADARLNEHLLCVYHGVFVIVFSVSQGLCY